MNTVLRLLAGAVVSLGVAVGAGLAVGAAIAALVVSLRLSPRSTGIRKIPLVPRGSSSASAR